MKSGRISYQHQMKARRKSSRKVQHLRHLRTPVS
uniref:Uncharacterized protein n=1 Tax=Arundo donax TaxID=35708 RepID=A0A0A9FFC1_ARUDO